MGGAISSVVGAIGGSSQARAGKRAQRAAQRQIDALEKNRQAVFDPSQHAADVSGMASNTMGNLTVDTEANKFKAEQADISLANVLDSVKAGGGGAGSATALAQAALGAKREASVGIGEQQQRNQILAAQGEERLQGVKMSEAQRVQGAKMQGGMFAFNAQEARDNVKLDRLTGMEQRAAAQREAGNASMWGGIGGTIGGAASLFSGGF